MTHDGLFSISMGCSTAERFRFAFARLRSGLQFEILLTKVRFDNFFFRRLIGPDKKFLDGQDCQPQKITPECAEVYLILVYKEVAALNSLSNLGKFFQNSVSELVRMLFRCGFY